jgi:hypothetical protein
MSCQEHARHLRTGRKGRLVDTDDIEPIRFSDSEEHDGTMLYVRLMDEYAG